MTLYYILLNTDMDKNTTSTNYSVHSDRILELLKNAYSYLFHCASQDGHWNEVRSTALAAMCLQYLEEGNSLWIDAIQKWLIQCQIKDSEQAGSWGEEIWDTTMAVIALKELEISSRSEIIDKALQWITKLFSINGRNNWHDELWETSWALIAIFRCGRTIPSIDIQAALTWLSSFQDSEGRIISPHYTAYYILVEFYSRKFNLSDSTRSMLSERVEKSVTYLCNVLKTSHSDVLWTGEAWSNGQIVLALCVHGSFPINDINSLERCIAWFEAAQENKGNWSDIEDTASSILGLLALFHLLEWKIIDSSASSSKIWQEVGFRLRKAIPTPRLHLKRSLIEYDKDTGYTTVNISSRTRQLLIAVFLFCFVSFLGWIANIIQIWQALYGS